MARVFLLNLVLATFWAAIAQAQTPMEFVVDMLIGYAIGFAVLSLFEREYPRRTLRSIGFIIFLIWEVIKSNFILAWYILRPDTRDKLSPAIIAVPLDVDTEIEITILASAITLTPGTLTVDIGYDQEGRRVLFIHELLLDDADEFRRQIKQGFERRILAISKGDAQP